MAHGTPDWGVTAGAVTVYQLTDLAELAVRLGSPITFDRRGDVIWWDDFECGLGKWTVTEGSAASDASISTVNARNGRASALLSASNDAPLTIEIARTVFFPSVAPVGVELHLGRVGVVDTFDLIVNFWDGVNRSNYQIRWDDSVNELQYLNAAGGFTTIRSYNFTGTFYAGFIPWKLVFDPSVREYARFIHETTTDLLADVAAQTVASTDMPKMNIRLLLTGAALFSSQVYIDDVIATINEPI